MKDFLGTEVGVGDKILYAGLSGRSAKLSRGFVVNAMADQIRIVRLVEWNSSTDLVVGVIYRLDNIAVVGSVPAVFLEQIEEARQAIADAKMKAYKGEIPWEDYRATEQVAIRVFKDIWG